MKFYRLLEASDHKFDYGTLILDTEIPTRFVREIMEDAWEEAHNKCDWDIGDFVECLPKEWNPRVICEDIFYV